MSHCVLRSSLLINVGGVGSVGDVGSVVSVHYILSAPYMYSFLAFVLLHSYAHIQIIYKP